MITSLNTDEPIPAIYLGTGEVGITNFTNLDEKGIMFIPVGKGHEIGEYMGLHGPYECVGGEVLIFCSKKESALMLLEQVQILVDSFGPVDQ